MMYDCPWHENGTRCPGRLGGLGGFTTLLGTLHGIDHNRRTEAFRCNVCGRRFKRVWRWEKVDG
jgi:hypothetical protein